MKKIAPFFALLILFCGCAKADISPAIKSNFIQKAIVNFNDFTYNANIKFDGEKVYVTITDTNAKGLTISCDSKTVTYTRNSFIKSADKTKVSCYNLAVILQDVISENLDKPAIKSNDKYLYTGRISAGEYELSLDSMSKFISLEIKSSNILVTFI